LEFADNYEHQFVNQGYFEERSIEETFSLAWKLLSTLPKEELKRISKENIEEYYGK
jgi:V/A-type H+-transporting ATPase subunit B